MVAAASWATVLAVSVLLAASSALALDSPVGTWKTVDEKSGKMVSEVELYDQGGKLYGKIVKLSEPTDAQGKPKFCTKCQGSDKDKPKIYKSEVWIEDGVLKVRGYLGFFHRTQTWQKAK